METKYAFTADGIAAFERDTLNDIFEELDDRDGQHIEDFDIFITIGNRSIKIPICADAYNGFMDAIRSAWEEDQA